MISAQKPKWILPSCSNPLPALFHWVHHSLPQTHHCSDKTPSSRPMLHPRYQVARPYPRRWCTAPCPHSRYWSPNNCVTASYIGCQTTGCQKLCSTRNYANVIGAMGDKDCDPKMSWSGIWRKQASCRMDEEEAAQKVKWRGLLRKATSAVEEQRQQEDQRAHVWRYSAATSSSFQCNNCWRYCRSIAGLIAHISASLYRPQLEYKTVIFSNEGQPLSY